MRSDFEKKAYFSGKKILKWYEYHMEDLEEDGITKEDLEILENMEEPTDDVSKNSSEGEDNSDLDDEVARIMQSFQNAHQDSVDSLFANYGE